MNRLIGRRWRGRDYTGPADRIAPKLIGHLVVRVLDDGTLLAGRIVETEAYMGALDQASHAFKGRRTARNNAMYAGPGTAYVYFTYGMHFCFNVVCGREGDPNAVLIRALEPIAGIETMHAHRFGHLAPNGVGRRKTPVKDTDLCSGPAKLCQALAIDRRLNGLNMVREEGLYVVAPGRALQSAPGPIVRTPRIGIDYAGDWVARPLRFVIVDHPHASVRRGRRARTRD